MSKKKESLPLIGTLRVHARGFGFIKPAGHDEIFIPRSFTNGAVDGDHVEVELLPPSGKGKGPEGKVVTVIKRGRSEYGATISHISWKGEVFAASPLLGADKPILVTGGTKKPLAIGTRVVVCIDDWGSRTNPPTCTVIKIIGSIDEAKWDIPGAIAEFGLPDAFPPKVLKELKKWGSSITPRQLEGRTDLTEITTLTIDPTTAKDFDDALSIDIDKKGHFHLGVHIADVSSYVQEGSALDQEALLRSNSTYLPGTCVPMLPPELSEQLCSLRPNVIRLTATAQMEFDNKGTLLGYSIFRSYINSKKRFTYEEAKEVLDGKKKSPYKKTLDQLVTLCHLLKKKRSLRGSIDFSLPEYIVEIDKQGEPTGIKTIPYDITHQLVEEFMLKANEIVALELKKRNLPLLFRIHPEPEKGNIEAFHDLARLLGFHLPPTPTQEEIQALFEKAKETPHAHRLSVAFIRSMKLAFYSKDNVGHFGLALEHYCHFTSPIRRYSDLIIHRQLFEKKIDEERLKAIALRCSEQEQVSSRAESHVKRLKKVRLLKKLHTEDPKRTFEAIVTQIKPMGLIFEVQELMLEGFLHVSNLQDDYFEYNPDLGQLKGRRTGLTHKISSPLTLTVETIDLITQEVKWRPVGEKTKRKSGSKPQRTVRKKRRR